MAGLLAFFLSPIGRWVGVGVLIALAYGAGDIRGRRIEYQKAEAAARAAQKAADDQDLQAARDANSDAAKVMDELKKQKETSDAQIATLQNQIATMAAPTGAPCLYGDGDVPASVVAPGVQHPAGARTRDAQHPRTSRVPQANPQTSVPKGK